VSESENVLPLDDSIWEHINHMNYDIGIGISNNKILNILGALEDIYRTIDKSVEDAKQCAIALAALFVASSMNKADIVWEELVVREATKNFDKGLQEVLDEKR